MIHGRIWEWYLYELRIDYYMESICRSGDNVSEFSESGSELDAISRKFLLIEF